MNERDYLKKHLEELTTQHSNIEDTIDKAFKNYASDDLIHRLKIQRLRLKEEIEQIKGVLGR